MESQETEQYQIFFPSVSFPVKRFYVVFSFSTSRSPGMLYFKTLMFLSLLNDFAGLALNFK